MTSGSECAPQAEVALLWEEYRETGDSVARDRLVLTFAPLVKYLAGKMKRSLPAHVSGDELISSGLEVLVRSLDRYDPAKGATLEQFLWTRIHGALVDELRRHDWAPRSLRKTEREVSGVRNNFRAVHRREPSDEELSEAVGITSEKLRTHRRDMQAKGSVASLNALVRDADGGSLEYGDLLVAVDGDPEAAAFRSADSDALSGALALLTTRQRTVLGLLYSQEMTLVEVGQILGVSESRVCQISGEAKGRLHDHLAGGSLTLAAH